MALTAQVPAASTAIAKLHAIRDFLNAHVVERGAEIDVMLVALIARKNAILLGPPGVAKSYSINLLTACIENANIFSLQLTKTTKPEEVFGPYDMVALKAGRFERLLDDYFGTAHVAFIDEVGKCSSALLNTFLTAMLDKKMRNGTQIVNLPLLSMFGASNEVPDSGDLGAFYDRFELRLNVKPLTLTGRARLRTLTQPVGFPKISLTELNELHTRAQLVRQNLPNEVFEGMESILEKLAAENMTISDRRYMMALDLIAANAVYNDRAPDPDDTAILASMLWGRPQDEPTVRRIVAASANPTLTKAYELLDEAVRRYEDYFAKVKDLGGAGRTQFQVENTQKFTGMSKEFKELVGKNPGNRKLAELFAKFRARHKAVYDHITGEV